MDYHFTKRVRTSFDEAVGRVTEELRKEGFGVLTEIDVQGTLRKKLGVEFPRYTILGACNPQYAYRALQAEDKIGTMLPCNVVVAEKGEEIEVSAVDPIASMAAIDNPELAGIAGEVRAKLRSVIDRV